MRNVCTGMVMVFLRVTGMCKRVTESSTRSRSA